LATIRQRQNVSASLSVRSVSRVDSAYGDRNFIYACIPVEEYADVDG